MKTHPILFNTEMVRAILSGTKTQSRRLVNDPYQKYLTTSTNPDYKPSIINTHKIKKGDILWIRETFNIISKDIILYKANPDHQSMKWKPSIHMPKEACRLFLEVTNVRIERLHEIEEQDSIAEGVEKGYCSHQYTKQDLVTYKDYTRNKHEFISAKKSFFTLWTSIYGIDSLKSDPYVWVYDFKVVEKPTNF
jgi:hypothetical protein